MNRICIFLVITILAACSNSTNDPSPFAEKLQVPPYKTLSDSIRKDPARSDLFSAGLSCSTATISRQQPWLIFVRPGSSKNSNRMHWAPETYSYSTSQTRESSLCNLLWKNYPKAFPFNCCWRGFMRLPINPIRQWLYAIKFWLKYLIR